MPVADPRTEVTQFVQDFRTRYDASGEIPWLEMPYNSVSDLGLCFYEFQNLGYQ